MLLVLLLSGPSIFAAGLHERMNEALQQLDSGDVESALTRLRELQVDYPESAELRFALGYVRAIEAQSAEPEAQKSAVNEALSLFDGLLYHADEQIAREATYNRATLLAQEAWRLDPQADYTNALKAMTRALQAFEEGAERFPDSMRIFQNLEHLRLKYKELLQQEPEEQEEEQQEQPQEDQPPILSRFGQASTEIPGARAEMSENTVQLITPDEEEAP
jgi:hypothetical protein